MVSFTPNLLQFNTQSLVAWNPFEKGTDKPKLYQIQTKDITFDKVVQFANKVNALITEKINDKNRNFKTNVQGASSIDTFNSPRVKWFNAYRSLIAMGKNDIDNRKQVVVNYINILRNMAYDQGITINY